MSNLALTFNTIIPQDAYVATTGSIQYTFISELSESQTLESSVDSWYSSIGNITSGGLFTPPSSASTGFVSYYNNSVLIDTTNVYVYSLTGSSSGLVTPPTGAIISTPISDIDVDKVHRNTVRVLWASPPTGSLYIGIQPRNDFIYVVEYSSSGTLFSNLNPNVYYFLGISEQGSTPKHTVNVLKTLSDYVYRHKFYLH